MGFLFSVNLHCIFYDVFSVLGTARHKERKEKQVKQLATPEKWAIIGKHTKRCEKYRETHEEQGIPRIFHPDVAEKRYTL